jgi:hypothetical protein
MVTATNVYRITYQEGTWELLEFFNGYFQNLEGFNLFMLIWAMPKLYPSFEV